MRVRIRRFGELSPRQGANRVLGTSSAKKRLVPDGQIELGFTLPWPTSRPDHTGFRPQSIPESLDLLAALFRSGLPHWREYYALC